MWNNKFHSNHCHERPDCQSRVIMVAICNKCLVRTITHPCTKCPSNRLKSKRCFISDKGNKSITIS